MPPLHRPACEQLRTTPGVPGALPLSAAPVHAVKPEKCKPKWQARSPHLANTLYVQLSLLPSAALTPMRQFEALC